MITKTKEFIEIERILAMPDIHPTDCTKITYFIIELNKKLERKQDTIDKIKKYVENQTYFSACGDVSMYLENEELYKLDELLEGNNE